MEKQTLTLGQFIALVNDANAWKREQDHDENERGTRQAEQWSDATGEWDCSIVDIPHAWGYAWLTSTHNGISICYNEGYSYDINDRDSLKSSTEGLSEVWEIDGVTVLDEDGDELDAYDLHDHLPSAFSSIDYDKIAIFSEPTEIDTDEDSDMETFTLSIDNAPDLRFTGELIAENSSSANNARSDYSGSTGRWTELALYRTIGGRYICHQIGRTQWQGEHDRYSGKVCETEAEVIAFFGHGWVAKGLYEEAGITDALEIE